MKRRSKVKFKRIGIRHAAIETYLVRHRGRAIRIYQMPIPGFWGTVSEDILEMAAAKAFKRGWSKIVLTWGDMLSSCCFDDGYAWLLAINVSMASRSDSTYRTDHFLCEMDREGNVFKEKPTIEDSYNPFENDGWDMVA